MSQSAVFDLGDLKNLDVLKAAFKALGWNVESNCECRGLYGQQFDTVAVNPQAGVARAQYDVAILRGKQDKLDLKYDGDMTLSTTALGDRFENLKLQYSVQNLTQFAKSSSGRATTKVGKNGHVKMRLEVTVSV